MKKLLLEGPALFKIMAVLYALLFAIFIFLNSFQETQHLFFIFAKVQYLDKVGHLFLMGFLSFTVNLALNGRNFKISKLSYLTGSAIVFTIATLEECSQLFIKGRDFEFADMFFNTLGIILFGEIARFIIKIFNSYKEEVETHSQLSR